MHLLVGGMIVLLVVLPVLMCFVGLLNVGGHC